MHQPKHGERTLTELDHVRIARLIAGKPQPVLEQLLDNTEVVASRKIPASVVTMYSQFEIMDRYTRQRHKLTLCYPQDAEPAAGFISILSPVGTGLIGLPVGAVARWQTPGGEEGAAEVTHIYFQPEASGDFTL